MKGVVTKVWPKNEKGPGSVVFSDGTKLSTFKEDLLATASANLGQMVEYETAVNGKYTNLASLARVAGAAEAQAAPKASDQILERIARALEAIVVRLGPAQVLPSHVAKIADDPQTKLGGVVGDDAAAAMFDALKRKHAKSPEAFTKAVEELLSQHGIGA